MPQQYHERRSSRVRDFERRFREHNAGARALPFGCHRKRSQRQHLPVFIAVQRCVGQHDVPNKSVAFFCDQRQFGYESIGVGAEQTHKVRLALERKNKTDEVAIPFMTITRTAKNAGMTFADLTPALNRQYGLRSDTRFVVVTNVIKNGAADDVGIEQGDVILEIGGYTVSTSKNLKELFGYLQTRGTPARIVVYRNSERYYGKMAF